MTESAHMASAPLVGLLSSSLHTFKGISATPFTVTLGDTGIHNTISTDRVALAAYNAERHDGMERDNNTRSANHCIDEDG